MSKRFRVRAQEIVVYPRAAAICVRAALGLPLQLPRRGLVYVPV